MKSKSKIFERQGGPVRHAPMLLQLAASNTRK